MATVLHRTTVDCFLGVWIVWCSCGIEYRFTSSEVAWWAHDAHLGITPPHALAPDRSG